MYELNHLKPQNVFIIIGLVFGILFLVLNPPFNGNDEPVHFLKASDISEGHFMPTIIGEGAGVVVPQGLEYITYQFSYRDSNQKLSINDIILRLDDFQNYNNESFLDISNVAIVIYPPVPYLASSVGIALGSILNLSPLVLLYLARLMSLLLWIIIIYLAIRITPIFKWVFLLLALMPMTIFQAASVSADTLTIGVSFLIIAILLKFSYGPEIVKITMNNIFALILLFIVLIFSKPSYFFLGFLFFLIPVEKFGSRKNRFLIFSFMAFLLIIISFWWYSSVSGLYVPENHSASIPGQVAFILANPANFLVVLINTIYCNTNLYLTGLVGQLGWSVLLPKWLVYTYVGIIFLTSLLDKSKIEITLEKKFNLFLVIFLITSLMFIIEYVAWTGVGSKIIEGVQGRYFIPIAPLFFLLFYNTKNTLKLGEYELNLAIGKNMGHLIIIFIILTLSTALVTIFTGIYV